MLVTLDVSVEEAELKAQEAQAAVAETLLRRVQRASESRAASEMEVDRARADRDVALAQIARIKAIIARKTLRAPFRARVGLADVHPGQYLNEGTQLTTLQGVDDAAHVDFTVAQPVAAGLRVGRQRRGLRGRVTSRRPRPGSSRSMRASTPRRAMPWCARGSSAPATGRRRAPRCACGCRWDRRARRVAVPVSALRKGPGGDHVFVIAPDQDGKTRAHAPAGGERRHARRRDRDP